MLAKRVQILGTGCAKCKILAENVRKAMKQVGIEAEVGKDRGRQGDSEIRLNDRPGLAIDGDVESAERVLSTEDIKKLLLS